LALGGVGVGLKGGLRAWREDAATAAPGALSIFRLMYCLALVPITLGELSKVAVRYGPLAHVYSALPLHRALFGLQAPPKQWVLAAGWLLVVALVLAALGIATRAALGVCLALFVLFFGTMLGWCKPLPHLDGTACYHDVHAFVLGILLFSPGVSGLRLSMKAGWPPRPTWVRDEEPTVGWPLLFVRASLATFYFGSAVTKLRDIGPSWADGYNLQTVLLSRYDLFPQLRLGHWLAQHHSLCVGASIGTLAFELCFATVLLWPRTHWTRWLYLAAGLLFHVATWLLMNIDQFLLSMFAVYLVFVEWPTARTEAAALVARLRRRSAQSAIPPRRAPDVSGSSGRGAWARRVGFALCAALIGAQLWGLAFGVTRWPVSDLRIFVGHRDYRGLVEVLTCEATIPGGGTRPCFGSLSTLGNPLVLRGQDYPSPEEAARAWIKGRLRGMPADVRDNPFPGRGFRLTLRDYPVEGGAIEVRRLNLEVPF
jgi:hypothetical protein